MLDKQQMVKVLQHTVSYLTETLLPFWIVRSPDHEFGGFLTYFDCNGQPTGETTKTFLMQIRMLYTMASAHRAGYGHGKCADLAKAGAEFILDHYWDEPNEGWVWIADRFGRPTVFDKIGYGQCFALYAFSEYFLATADERGRDAALRTYAAITKNMIDTRYGGYFEIMQPDWQPARPGKYGGDRKSMDVHMHMMEALTSLYEMSGHPTHRRRLLEVINLILTRMLHPEYGTGYIQFSLDFKPLPAIKFDVEWGRDAEPEDEIARPLDHTSYGHNMEFVWLLLHATKTMCLPSDTYTHLVRRICDHCVEYGIDHEHGGVFVEGLHNAPARITEKQFWQQAEVMVALLDAYTLFEDEKYWLAFRNVYDFVFDKFVNISAGGEWYERLNRKGSPIDDALGHAWKISYHTIRSMIQIVRRLSSLLKSD